MGRKIRTLVTVMGIAMLSCSMPTLCIAGQTGAGSIHHIIITGGIVLFDHTGTRSGVPACGQGLPLRWAFNGTTAEGQAKLSLLLTAYSTGKEVTVYGSGTCSTWGDTEDVVYIATAD